MFEPFQAIRVERPRPDVIREHRHAGWFAVATVCFGAFMGQLDASIVTLAFPAMQQDFGSPLAAVQWVSLAYLLTLVGLLPAAGRIADSTGRKQMYLYGFALFSAASVACGFAPNLGVLVGLRVLQAVGAAMLQANSVALVVTSVPREQMRSALGIQSAAQAIGLAAGPVVGGLLVSALDWRWVFWIKLPIGLIGLVAGWFLLPRTRERTPMQRFDILGLLLLLLASGGVLLGLSGLGGLGLSPLASVVLIIGGLGLAVGWLRWEGASVDPLVRPEILRARAVSVGLIGALCGYLVLFGPLTLIPQTEGSHGRVGLALTCLPLGFGVAAVLAQRLLPRRLGPRGRAALGAGLAAVALALLAWALPQPGWLAALLFVTGLGLGVFIPANNTTIMAAIPSRLSATGGGLVNMARSLGTALGVAVVTVCLHAGAASGAVTALICLAIFGAIGAVSGTLTGNRPTI
ncbi:MFS transporter [Microlunatus soli]|uniref:Drug resistance transporter, EmrB/QacA subfamily n=1 Tax=Microlunatus soli TaxID=630515 RepID=A0A1H1QV89_9ACTN|nr:MFS transporter [Microlunatus soli]SDS27360.1 drug resistance transporter, EmrB/QacA subfamily [Microlunatus soli]